MNTQHPDFPKLLQLISSNEYENIALAISIAPSIEIDIVKAMEPFLETNLNGIFMTARDSRAKGNHYLDSTTTWTTEKLVCCLLQLKEIVIPAYSEANLFDGLVFCQNLETLKIDVQDKELRTNFQYYKYYKFKNLFLKSCQKWVLSPKAIENLSLQKLQILDITGVSYKVKDRNSIFSVPKELGNMSSLHKLSLNHNLLQRLPEELLNLTALTELNIYTLQKNLYLPDKLFSLPQLSFVGMNYVPSNTLQYTSPKVRFNISEPSFWTFFKLVAWKKNPVSYYNPTFKDFILIFFYNLLQILHFPIFLFGSDAQSKIGYYFRASILVALLLMLSPIYILYFSIRYWGSLPDLYLKHTSPDKRSSLVFYIAQKATPHSSSIEGIGNIGCFGAIFLFLIFFLLDPLVPMICRYLFLPLAIVLTPVDWVIGAVEKLRERK